MFGHKTETEDLKLSITKNCETLIARTHTKPHETLEPKLTKTREAFSCKPPVNLGLDYNWMIELTGLELLNSIFYTTEKK